MFSKMILTHCCNYIIKHLEKSKCFFRAQKGVKDVYLGMDSNRFWVVGIFLVIRFNCRNYSCDFNRFQKQKVGDPIS